MTVRAHPQRRACIDVLHACKMNRGHRQRPATPISPPLRCSCPRVLANRARAGVGVGWTGVGVGFTITADAAEVRSGVSAAKLSVTTSSAGISQTIDVAVRAAPPRPPLLSPCAPPRVHHRARTCTRARAQAEGNRASEGGPSECSGQELRRGAADIEWRGAGEWTCEEFLIFLMFFLYQLRGAHGRG